MNIVLSLHRILNKGPVFLLRSYSDVRDANVMRMILKGKYNESRIDHTYRDPERAAEEGWILLPNLQRAADCTAVPEEMDRYASKEGCTGEVCGAVWEEENRHTGIAE